MPRQIATSTVRNRTASQFAWSLWAIYLLGQAAALLVVFLARSYSDRAKTLPLFSCALLFLPFSLAFPTIGALRLREMRLSLDASRLKCCAWWMRRSSQSSPGCG